MPKLYSPDEVRALREAGLIDYRQFKVVMHGTMRAIVRL